MPAAGLPDLALAAGALISHINSIDVSMNNPEELMLDDQSGQVLPARLSAKQRIRFAPYCVRTTLSDQRHGP